MAVMFESQALMSNDTEKRWLEECKKMLFHPKRKIKEIAALVSTFYLITCRVLLMAYFMHFKREVMVG